MDPTTHDDPFDLARFVRAQAANYDEALAELRAGRKRTHWIWYVLPQLRGLGTSPMSVRYAISGLAEARAYLAHPVLGPRLVACVQAMLSHVGTPPEVILGGIDARKFHSCLTLFARVSAPDSVFHRALAAFFGGQEDEATRRGLAAAGEGS
jgi:uncharacterized protein (DUF1810 family)